MSEIDSYKFRGFKVYTPELPAAPATPAFGIKLFFSGITDPATGLIRCDPYGDDYTGGDWIYYFTGGSGTAIPQSWVQDSTTLSFAGSIGKPVSERYEGIHIGSTGLTTGDSFAIGSYFGAEDPTVNNTYSFDIATSKAVGDGVFLSMKFPAYILGGQYSNVSQMTTDAYNYTSYFAQLSYTASTKKLELFVNGVSIDDITLTNHALCSDVYVYNSTASATNTIFHNSILFSSDPTVNFYTDTYLGTRICDLTQYPVQIVPSITTHPQSETIPKGGSFSELIVIATSNGSGTLTYQWKSYSGSAWSDVVGETTNAYTPTSAGTYRCAVFNDAGTTNSNSAVLEEAETYCLGGEIERTGGYVIHTFTEGGTLRVGSSVEVDYLMVGGGGGSGSSDENGCSGGGGGGEVKTGTATLTTGDKTVVIGDGGAADTDGEDTTFNGLTASGGGRGGGNYGTLEPGTKVNGGGGSSIGGANPHATGGDGSSYDGGDALYAPYAPSGGGAGASENGSDGIEASPYKAGDGGDGVSSDISGSTTYYGGGGGGGSAGGGGDSCAGHGGLGGGGNGNEATGGATNGSPNTGGGGGGSYITGTSGGSGIVIIRYLLADLPEDSHYVSTTGTGTWAEAIDPDTPCSLATAVANIAAGETAVMRAGTYQISSMINMNSQGNSGTSGSWITFMPYPSEAVTIQATAAMDVMFQQSKDYWKFTGDITWDCNNNAARAFGIGWYDSNASVEGFEADGNTIKDWKTGDNACGVYIGSDYSAVMASNVTIKNCTITGLADPTGLNQNYSGIMVFGADDFHLENNEITQVRHGIYLKHSSINYADHGDTVKKNWIHAMHPSGGNGNASINVNTNYTLIEDNICETYISLGEDAQSGGSSNGNYCVINHNTLTSSIGFILDGGSTHNTVTNNICTARTDAGSNNTWDYNMYASGAKIGSNDIPNASPTYVGGATPTTIAGFALDTGSNGENAASDSEDMGADTTKVGPTG